MPENREKTGQFARGKSGNPGGRPKWTEEQRKALEDVRALAPTAARELRRMLTAKDTPWSQKLRAIEIVLERTYGKPAAKVTVTQIPQGDFVLRIAENHTERKDVDNV